MARVKVSKVPVEKRISNVTQWLREREADGADQGCAYALGYLESTLARALDLLPPGKRELFLASLEKQARPKTRKVRNLMSGKEMEIDYDTPRCCDPSTELYHSM